MLMSIHSPLPALDKRVFDFQEPCPPWASDLFSQFAFAHAGQREFLIYLIIFFCLPRVSFHIIVLYLQLDSKILINDKRY